MKFTNIYNIPEAFVRAVTGDLWKPREGYYRVSELIRTPLARKLIKMHWDEITLDVSEYLSAMVGTALHGILEKRAPKGAEAERTFETAMGDQVVKGTHDLYWPTRRHLQDYKSTSAASLGYGVSQDHVNQVNAYAWQRRKAGQEVNEASIVYYLRDWTTAKARYNPDFPRSAVVEQEVPLWSFERQESYIAERLALHNSPARKCTDVERWLRDEHFACKKPANKRARKKYDSLAEAQADVRTGEEVEHRPGRYVYCEDYCQARSVCPFACETRAPMKLTA